MRLGDTAAVGSSNPAATCYPDFGPGMRIGLAYDEIISDPVEFTTLVPGHDTGRNPRGAHQQGKTAGVVFAKSAATVEQELVDDVALQYRGLQGIDEFLLVKHGQNVIDNIDGIVIFFRQLLAQGNSPGIGMIRVTARHREIIGIFLQADQVG